MKRYPGDAPAHIYNDRWLGEVRQRGLRRSADQDRRPMSRWPYAAQWSVTDMDDDFAIVQAGTAATRDLAWECINTDVLARIKERNASE